MQNNLLYVKIQIVAFELGINCILCRGESNIEALLAHLLVHFIISNPILSGKAYNPIST